MLAVSPSKVPQLQGIVEEPSACSSPYNCTQQIIPLLISATHKRTEYRLLLLLQDVVQKPFARLTYTDAVELLLKAKVKFEFPVKWGSDLQSEHERYLTEKECDGTPLFVTDYPKDIKVPSLSCLSCCLVVLYMYADYMRPLQHAQYHGLLCAFWPHDAFPELHCCHNLGR